MKINYQREFRHNYLIIDPEELVWQGYESQMLLRNQIEGVLRLQIRQIDEKIRFFYEITSKQPLSRILENRNIQAEEIRKLMLGLFGVLERMDIYLLREENIFLEPEYLYVDPDTFRVWLCVIPGLKKNFSENFGKLLEYLLGSVNHQDKESVVLAYGLYQETRKENYGLADLIRMLQGGQKQKEESVYCQDRNRKICEQKNEFSETEEDMGGERTFKDEKRFYHGMDEKERRQQETEGKIPWKKKWKQWKDQFSRKSDKEEILPTRVPWEMMFQDLSSENNQEKETLKQKYEKESSQTMTGQGTVLLADFSTGTEQRTLRALDREDMDIPILYYPFIIGKQENLVDFKLDRNTVSRLHIRIDKRGDSYWIKDLNSTNGTLLRGRLLENNEEAEIYAGDEICIARFRYRFE
ncbi:MAG: FHA domain-containing protein [Lachnospiraceae bacterium]|nr:FHA domain-containing protein [Lachnospiraceae bacterium]